MKKKLFNLTLWWAVIGASVWVGGTVFMISVINPQWSQNPPSSVRQFFSNTEFNQYIGNFFGPKFMALRSLIPQLLTVMLSSVAKQLRPYLLFSLSCTILTIGFTLIYIYPINAILMHPQDVKPDAFEIQTMTAHWLIADRVRFFINFLGFLALLKAFKR